MTTTTRPRRADKAGKPEAMHALGDLLASTMVPENDDDGCENELHKFMVVGSAEGAYTAEHPEVVAAAQRAHSNPVSMAKAMRLSAANKEIRALKEWQRTRVGEPPATPNLTAIKEGLVMTTATKTKTACIASSSVVEYTKNGQRIPSQRPWTLSRVAWFYTAGIESKDSPRTNVAGLEKVLKKLGVDDPRKPGWEVTLPNGVVLGAIEPDATVAAKPAPVKAVAKKAAKQTGGNTLAPSPKARAARKAADTRKRNTERKAS